MAPVASVTSSVAIVDPGPDPRHVEEPVTQLAGSGGVAVTSGGGLMRCLYRDISPTVADWSSVRRRSDWREVQANRAMAALLMPRRLFRRLTLREIRELGVGAPPVAAADVEALTTAITRSTTRCGTPSPRRRLSPA
jgi:hypothetical protein